MSNCMSVKTTVANDSGKSFPPNFVAQEQGLGIFFNSSSVTVSYAYPRLLSGRSLKSVETAIEKGSHSLPFSIP